MYAHEELAAQCAGHTKGGLARGDVAAAGLVFMVGFAAALLVAKR